MQEANYADMETAIEVNEKGAWEASRRVWLIVLTLAFVSLIVALDATILVTALPVRLGIVPRHWHTSDSV